MIYNYEILQELKTRLEFYELKKQRLEQEIKLLKKEIKKYD